jgi:hypothetical protein
MIHIVIRTGKTIARNRRADGRTDGLTDWLTMSDVADIIYSSCSATAIGDAVAQTPAAAVAAAENGLG